MSTRLLAIDTLVCVLQQQQSLSQALQPALEQVSPRDKGLLQELCYGVLRWQPQLDKIAKHLLQKPFKKHDYDVHILIMLGLYQLLYTRIPPHAAIGESVETAKLMEKDWATGLVNGVLRRFQREQEEISTALQGKAEYLHAHPQWLLAKLQHNWPEHWQQIVSANNAYPPMTLRVNQQQQSRDAYLQTLIQAGIAAHATPFSPWGITLEQAQDVQVLPGFFEGSVSVQDEAAQLAATLLAPQAGEHLLDACCAPGGKTAHLLESCPEARITALDLDYQRQQRTRATLSRLGLAAQVLQGDASQQNWWDGQLFDAILADVPCSATGVIRRHPDIKHLRTSEDIVALAELQLAILSNLWQMLKPGGRLLYATCSVLPQENNRIVERFLKQQPEAQIIPLDVPWGLPQSCGRQLLPQPGGHDGFFYALLTKVV
ncbi:16S rRNA (cytosine(967)-C(5))-methyltransferase RsmB [Balneatrix alpica]|uniref:16S rRNA (cytosine(967)-C(5))-methyltransferase n=1 Tax=Balneatrix alpica TaxID=75684 RepID=A0ABV5ZA51_9GAMM|nr:16S rRNA (cytosine(967)-C(5))-methyltransferase RsmB [Balneatrix alpica]